MAKGDTQKTDEDRSKEEKLITRLMELVSQRNEVGGSTHRHDMIVDACCNNCQTYLLWLCWTP